MEKKNGAVMQVVIQVTKDGRVGVSGFPKNVIDAMKIMHAATGSVIEFFGNHAKDGKLDKMGTIIESKIIQPKMPVIVPGNQPVPGPRMRKDGLYKK